MEVVLRRAGEEPRRHTCLLCGGLLVPLPVEAVLQDDDGAVCGSVCVPCTRLSPEAIRDLAYFGAGHLTRQAKILSRLASEAPAMPTADEFRLVAINTALQDSCRV